jgi:transcriptional antiterminator RfaH
MNRLPVSNKYAAIGVPRTLSPGLYPETLLEEMARLPSHRRWWALHTKPRQEKTVARCVVAFQIPFYLPLLKNQTESRGRAQVSYVPLFASYVFVFGSDEERVRALSTKRVAQALWVEDQDRLCFEHRQFRQLLLTDTPLTLELRLVSGKYVQVRRGPLSGIEGVVVKRDGASRLLVAVSFLQQGVSVEIEDCL